MEARQRVQVKVHQKPVLLHEVGVALHEVGVVREVRVQRAVRARHDAALVQMLVSQVPVRWRL